MPGFDNSLFKHARAASTVRVDQVPRGGGREVEALFRGHIGSIRNIDFCENDSSMEITFFNPDDAIKSLSLSGYIVSGQPIIVAARPTPRLRATSLARSPDARRNLYVLGLPFDLSLAELESVFSRFGTVIHSVILATVDNASRRRGFVVMSTHAQAKSAMDNISQTSIRGSLVDVSWAVVQRSQGFLDGGDRAATLEGQGDSAPLSSDRGAIPAFRVSSALSDSSKTISSLSGAHSGRTSIIVHNLPALLFTQDSDLEPLFYPFGEVKEIRRQGTSSFNQSRAGTTSVLVTYSSVTGARDAKIALHGQAYGDTPLIVESFPPFYNHETSWKPGRDHLSRSSLNPRASPFVIDNTLTVSAPPTCRVSEDFPDYFSKPSSSNLAPTFRGHRSLPASSLPSRSNSAASWSVPVARQSFYA
ncbi:hypothetical protein DFH94DRAFT_721902 [Russula ochroleuca]|uniref:RRM domain-containing protein n=1 Tax=Russula ochroleuca TaxID=152965 RepID=A0A9P5N0Q1_9AGAM|nr:hypothetical protein DFH94DRAFT_721902 [Russula ochroleuca]